MIGVQNKMLILAFIFIAHWGDTFAQSNNENYGTTSVYLELGGAAGIWSVNFDRSVWQISNSFKLHARAGLGLLSEFNGAGFADILVPISGTILFGKTAHRIEVGGGVTYFNWTKRDINTVSGFNRTSEFLGHLTAGYRYQKIEGGLMFRVTYSPIIYNYSNAPFEHWAGISIGYTFKKNNPGPSN